jgi:hypothetical protein
MHNIVLLSGLVQRLSCRHIYGWCSVRIPAETPAGLRGFFVDFLHPSGQMLTEYLD